MPITVQCSSCSKKYKVADTLAGKKIRCKGCGGVVAVPAADEGADEIDLSVVEPEKFSLDRAIANAHRTASAGSKVGAKPNDPPADDSDPFAQEDETGGGAAFTPSRAANPDFSFPAAATLDSVLPFLLAVGGMGWLIYAATQADAMGRPWVPHVRWIAYVLLFVAVVFPLVLHAVRRAGEKLYFGMPTGYALKVFGAFAFPYALGMVLAINGGSIVQFILGAFIGLIIGLTAFWFLFRLRPIQTPQALVTTTVFFSIGCAIALGLLMIANAAALVGLSGYKSAHTFAQSPVGPFLSWHPEKPATEKPAKSGGIEIAGDPSGTDLSTTQPAVTTQPADATATSRPAEDPTAQAIPNIPDATNPATTKTTGPMIAANVPPTGASPDATAPTPVPPSTEPKTPDQPPAARSPILAAPPAELAGVGEFEDVYFAPSSMPGGVVGSALFVKARAAIADNVEIWSILPAAARKGALTPQHPEGARSDYFLGPKAIMAARIVDFPNKAIEVRTTANDAVVKTIDLNTTENGDPTLLGFGMDGQLVVLWEKGEHFAFQCLSAASGVQTRGAVIPGFTKGKSNLALSPDGRYLAMSVTPHDGRGPAIELVELFGHNSTFPMIPLDQMGAGPVVLSGMAFSADSQKIAVFWEQGANALLIGWRVGTAKPYTKQVHFSSPVPNKPVDYAGPALDWIQNDTRWLLYGRVVVETDAVKVVGDIGIADAKSHCVVDLNTIALVVPTGDKSKLILAKLAPPDKSPKPGTRAAVGASPVHP